MYNFKKAAFYTLLFLLAVQYTVGSKEIKWTKIERNLPVISERPVVEPQENNFALKFKTRLETPPASLSLRALPREKEVRFTMGFDTFKEKSGNSKNHEIIIDTKYFDRAFAGGKMPKEGADIVYTLEVYDPENCCSFLYEGTFRVVKDNGKYKIVPCIVEGPFITKVKPDSVELFFKTDKAVKSTVSITEFWGELKENVTESKETTTHKIQIKNLQSAKKYRYSIVINGSTYIKSRFRTAPEITGKSKFSFSYMGDSRMGFGSGHERFSGLNRKALENSLIEAKREHARFILFSGDIISGYSSSELEMQIQYEQFKRVLGLIGHMIPLYPCIGNHDLTTETYVSDIEGTKYHVTRDSTDDNSSLFSLQFNNFEESFPPPEKSEGKTGPSYRGTVYSFDYGNCHFTILNSVYWYTLIRPETASLVDHVLKNLGGNRQGYLMDNQLRWLAADLKSARNRGIKHIMIMFHEPVFPNSSHVNDSMFWGTNENGKWTGLNDKGLVLGDVADMRERFLKILSDNKVLAVLCGHEHGYSRLKIDNTLSKTTVNPIWQITSAGAGAPYTTQNLTTPWADKVINFSEDQNIVIFNVNEDKVGLKVISSSGEILDKSDDLYEAFEK